MYSIVTVPKKYQRKDSDQEIDILHPIKEYIHTHTYVYTYIDTYAQPLGREMLGLPPTETEWVISLHLFPDFYLGSKRKNKETKP